MKSASKAKYALYAVAVVAMLLPVNAAFNGLPAEQDTSQATLEVSRTSGGAVSMDLCTERHTVDTVTAPVAHPLMAAATLGTDVQVTAGEGLEIQPAIASDGSGNLFVGMIADFGSGYNAYFTGSNDGGTTWADNAVAWQIDTPEYPDVDYWGEGTRFFGTMVPNPSASDGSELYVMEVGNPTDFDNYAMVYWDWADVGSGYTDFKAVNIGCDNGVEDYAYGGISIIGNHGSGLVDTPFFSYQATEDGTAWIYTFTSVDSDFTLEGCTSTSMDADPATHYAYPTWNYLDEQTGLYNVYISVFDFGTWDEYQGYPIHPGLGDVYINDSAVSVEYLDISAYNNNVVIVAQTSQYGSPNKDITCYYSSDGLETIQTSTIAASQDSELYPKVIHTGSNQAIAIFVKNSNLYVTTTEDGGATWTEPEQVNDQDGTVETTYSTYAAADLSRSGTLWADTRNGNSDLYYDEVAAPGPLLNVATISGGFGVTATVTNSGSGDAENAEWSITFDGPVFIGKEKTGAVTVPAGGEAEIKSGFIFGIGRATIRVQVEGASKSAEGLVLGPLVLGIE